jgi:uncharacterized protein (DUF433 family)
VAAWRATGYTARMSRVVRSDPEILGGTPCFSGTRVPVRSLFDHLESGYTVDYFLAQFPTVNREQVIALLESVRQQTEEGALAEARV